MSALEKTLKFSTIFMSGAVEQWLRLSIEVGGLDTRSMGSRIHDSLGLMNGGTHSPCSSVADILFKFTNYFEQRNHKNKVFNDFIRENPEFFSISSDHLV